MYFVEIIKKNLGFCHGWCMLRKCWEERTAAKKKLMLFKICRCAALTSLDAQTYLLN